MDDLVVWLRQQLDDDERLARAVLADLEARGLDPALCHDLRRTEGNTTTTTRVAVYDPRQALREVDAQRRIIGLHPLTTYADDEPGFAMILNDHICPGEQTPCATLRLLALPYVDRPGYLEQWRP